MLFGRDKSALRLSWVAEYPAKADKSAPTAVQISQHIFMKEECSETTLFRTTEENALRIYYSKPYPTIYCGLWWNINHEHKFDPGKQNTDQNRYLALVFRRFLRRWQVIPAGLPTLGE